jgi:hypothetical protein
MFYELHCLDVLNPRRCFFEPLGSGLLVRRVWVGCFDSKEMFYEQLCLDVLNPRRCFFEPLGSGLLVRRVMFGSFEPKEMFYELHCLDVLTPRRCFFDWISFAEPCRASLPKNPRRLSAAGFLFTSAPVNALRFLLRFSK